MSSSATATKTEPMIRKRDDPILSFDELAKILEKDRRAYVIWKAQQERQRARMIVGLYLFLGACLLILLFLNAS